MPNFVHTRPGISFQSVSINTSGTFALIAAHSQRRIRLYAAHLGCSVTNGFQWASSTTMLSGTVNMGVNTKIELPYNPLGWLETLSNEALGIVLAATPTGGFGGHITYAYIGASGTG